MNGNPKHRSKHRKWRRNHLKRKPPEIMSDPVLDQLLKLQLLWRGIDAPNL